MTNRYWVITTSLTQGIIDISPKEWYRNSLTRGVQDLISRSGGSIEVITLKDGDYAELINDFLSFTQYGLAGYWEKCPFPACPVTGQPHHEYYSWCSDCKNIYEEA